MATPAPLTGRFEHPGMEMPLSRKVTVPTGVPAPKLTVAVNVADAPKTLVDGPPTAVVVGMPLTVCVIAVELLAAKLVEAI